MGNQRQREILVVDHEPDYLQLMCNALRAEGYKALPASGYRAGINTFAIHLGKIDLLVTAIALPDRNGCELAKSLLVMQPNLSVLFVSAPTGAEVCRFHGMPGQGMHFLEKPLNRNEFVRLVRLILEPALPVRTMGAG